MSKRPPKVRLARPAKKLIQLRYTDPETKKEIRISTGTRDEQEALEQKKQLEAKLLLGVDAKPRRRLQAGPSMLWEDFREKYYELHLVNLRPRSAKDCQNRLDLMDRILKPRTLGDVASSEALHELQQKLLTGAERRMVKGPDGTLAVIDRPRSPHSVKVYMAVLIASLNWAADMGWLQAVPRVKRVRTSKLRHMKGRPITLEEFERMIKATASIVGEKAAPSWIYMLRGLWESGLRLNELIHVHWTNEAYIVPDWPRGALPVLCIPADMQKNDTEEAISLLPGFEKLLLMTPEENREGWAFNPLSLQTKVDRKILHDRVTVEWAGKVIGRIGKKAGVIVLPATGGNATKYASAHDLRRSCADRLVAAGVSERDVAAVMRHASVETTRRHYAPGNVQRTAGSIRQQLASGT